MKKVLIGLAAGALAFTATGVASVSAAGTSVYDIIGALTGDADSDGLTTGEVGTLLIDSAGLAAALDDCGATGNNNGLPNYTVFFPASDAIFGGVLAALELSLGELLAQPALIKTVLLNHVVKQDIAPIQFVDASNTVFVTMGGLTLVKTGSDAVAQGGNNDGDPDLGEFFINGYKVAGSAGPACNGWVYPIIGLLSPVTASTTTGTTTDGSVTAASGEGLPKTGSESLALTYAALASLVMGAGVLVIRRRSVA